MIWKAIGCSVIGTSHTAQGKSCDDAIKYVVPDGNTLICAISDGAGSALQAAKAAEIATQKTIEFLSLSVNNNEELTEAHIYALAEDIYDSLETLANEGNEPIQEYSCTLLGCVLMAGKAVFFQIGDGAIVRSDGSGYYTPVWWPETGEYLNTTSFVINDRTFANLNVAVINETVNEVAIFSDGLQMLALNMEGRSVHQPFFTDLFKYLRMADDSEKLNILNGKLAAYLDSPAINERTDDDKTLFLATR